MSDPFSKIKKKEIVQINDYVGYSEGGIISKSVVQRDSFSLTFFSFSSGEDISEYQMDGDVIVHLLEGEIEVCLDRSEYYILKKNELIVVPYKTAHSVHANVPSKAIFYIVK